MDSTESPTIRFSVLGPLRVESGGIEIDVGGTRQRLVLAALLLSPNRAVSVDRLVDLLWGEHAPPRAQSTLHVYVAKLRKALAGDGPRNDVVQTAKPGYRVTVASDRLDLLEFHELTARAREATGAGRHEQAAELFGQAIALPRGPLLADLADHEFVTQEAQAFEQALVAATVEAFECQLSLGRHSETIPDLERLVTAHPFDERLSSLLMVALYRSGRQVDALAAYTRLRTRLAEELGVDPGPDIQSLELQILDHHPLLASPPLRGRLDEALPTVTRATRSATTAFLLVDGERVPLRRVVTTIGRLPDQNLVAPHPDVSRRHAEIRRTAGGYVVVDVGSTNGTVVNGRRVTDHVLRPGDRIEVGDSIMVFHDERADHL